MTILLVMLIGQDFAPRTDLPFRAAVATFVMATTECPADALTPPWRQLHDLLGESHWRARDAAHRAIAALGDDGLPIIVAAAQSADPEVYLRAETLFYRLACRTCHGSGICPECAGWGDTISWPGRRWYCPGCSQNGEANRVAIIDGIFLPTKCFGCRGTGRPPQ